MQEAGFRALGIPAEYLRVEIPAGALPEALPLLQKSAFAGWNCTLPHKEAMFALCPEKDEAARESGTVNTVVFSEKGLRGHSTDADGWEDAVTEAWQLDLPSQRVLLLGCGGVGRTLAFRLARRGCRHLRLANRNPSKPAELAAELLSSKKLPVSVVPWNPPELSRAAQDSDLLIQATPLGLSAADPLPVPESSLHSALRIYDTVYHRDFTPLVRAARARHLPVLDGLGMLLHQGARALALWSGQPAPLAEMRAALETAAGRPL
jgi:shikimate dehydrogenase